MAGNGKPAHQFLGEENPMIHGGNVDDDKQNIQLQQQQNDPQPQLAPQQQQKSQPQSSQKQEAREVGKAVSSSTTSVISPTDSAFDAKAEERSMKKRAREKKRRNDVNQKFSDLTKLLQRIHEEENNGDKEATKLFLSSFKANQSGLIAHTGSVLDRIHRASKRRKQETKKLKEEIEQVRKAGEETAARLKEALLPAPGTGNRMMMAPVMMSPDGTPMIMPQSMQQQPFFPMPTQFASGGAVQHMYSYPTYQMPQQVGNTNNNQSSGRNFMMPSFAPVAATANSRSEANNGTPIGTAPVPTPVAQLSTNSVSCPPAQKTNSSDDGDSEVI